MNSSSQMYAHTQSRWGKDSKLPASHISSGARHDEYCLIQHLLKSIKALHWRSWEMENKALQASARMCEWKKNWWLSSLIFIVHKDPDYKMQLVISEFLICLLGINKIVVYVCIRETGIILHCTQVWGTVCPTTKKMVWMGRQRTEKVPLEIAFTMPFCFGEKRKKNNPDTKISWNSIILNT